MFILQENPIDSVALKNTYHHSTVGAMVSFEGTIRDDSKKNKTVSALLYIADTLLVNQEAEQIIKETLALFQINNAICVQRIGQVKVGESAIWIGIWAGHRDESFKACRHIIEEFKKRLHIWKKEIYTDGSSQWIHGDQTSIVL